MRLPLPALLLGLLFLIFASSTSAQTLGEVARQEEVRRKNITTESKVYTNKDLARVPPATTPPSAAPPPPTTGDAPAPEAGTSAAAASESPAEARRRDQAHWSGRMKELQDTLDRNLTYLEALQSRINALATDFVNRDDPAQRAKIEADRVRAIAEQERLQAQVLADRKAIADLQEEARRASVPPGWLR